jgi:hypothetical protein
LAVSAAHGGAVNLTDYARLMAYARSTFGINPELAIVLRAPVRAALFLRAPVRAPSRLLLGHVHRPVRLRTQERKLVTDASTLSALLAGLANTGHAGMPLVMEVSSELRRAGPGRHRLLLSQRSISREQLC